METLDYFIFGQDSQIAKTHEHPIMKTYFKEKQEENWVGSVYFWHFKPEYESVITFCK